MSPIKKRGTESPTDSEQLALNNFMVSTGSRPDDRFAHAVVAAPTRPTSFVAEEEDARMAPLGYGNTQFYSSRKCIHSRRDYSHVAHAAGES